MNIIQRRALIGGLLAVPLLRPWRAFGQMVSPAAPAFVRLFETTALVGITGVTGQEDTLQTFTLPAGQLANIGDELIIRASGTLGATTDSKTMRIRAGATQWAAAPVATVATSLNWRIDIRVMKRAASGQTIDGLSSISGASGTTSTLSSTSGIVDTAPIVLTVTGVNATSPVASSITCQYFTVDFIRGT